MAPVKVLRTVDIPGQTLQVWLHFCFVQIEILLPNKTVPHVI